MRPRPIGPRPGERERGSVAIEAVIGIPAFLLFVALILLAGRLAIATQTVEAAANDAARTASIARTQAQAASTATAAARTSLANQGLACVSGHVQVDTTGFAAPAGTPAQVTATVTCQVNLADLALPGLPGTRTVTASMRSAIDTYRER